MLGGGALAGKFRKTYWQRVPAPKVPEIQMSEVGVRLRGEVVISIILEDELFASEVVEAANDARQ
jgi:hypothetical protein